MNNFRFYSKTQPKKNSKSITFKIYKLEIFEA